MKSKIFLKLIIFAAAIFLTGGAAFAEASGCCVIGADSCLDTAGTSCSVGTYYSSPCAAISTCSEDVPGGSVPLGSDGTCEEDDPSGTCDEVAPAGSAELDSGGCSAGMQRVSGVCIPTTAALGLPGGPDDDTTVDSILKKVLNWILGIIGVLSMLMLVVAGFQYLMASGDEKNLETAKQNIKYSIIGLAIALTSFLIVEAISLIISGI